jgi:hypothetical protein
MKVTIFVVALVSAGLSFPAGFIGGAVLNRPARQNYDSKIEQIRIESEKSEQAIKEKLRQSQGVVQGLEKEVRYLNNELRNMTNALGEANRKVRETEAELLSNIELKNQEEGRASSKEDNLIKQNTITRLKKTLDEQTEENKRLLALCKEAGIQTAAPIKTSFKSGEIIYRGKIRDTIWFDTMYKRFCGNIVCMNGEYFDKSLLEFQDILPNKLLPKGTVVKVPSRCKVLQVLGPGEALILREAYQAVHITGNHSGLKGAWSRIAEAANAQPEILFHLSGYERQLIDEQTFSYEGPLISIGTYEYSDALGASRTVQSFRIFKSFYEPLTKEQFADALNNGFILSYPNERRGRVEIKTVP